jgi:hypothetical protein
MRAQTGGERTPQTLQTANPMPRRNHHRRDQHMTAKARILKGHGNRTCTKHQWDAPWPAAVVRHLRQCSAWMVPPWAGT